VNARHLSPAETADALGITRRALRIYEQRGLVRPLRTGNGYRAYGPEALTRLHQVLALKRLGFTLAAIGVLIAGRLARLEDVLELQEAELAKRRDDAERGLALVRAARARLSAGGTLDLDDLTTLTKETTMTDQIPEWAQKMQPAVDRNFSAADKATMIARAGQFDQAKVQADGRICSPRPMRSSGPTPARPRPPISPGAGRPRSGSPPAAIRRSSPRSARCGRTAWPTRRSRRRCRSVPRSWPSSPRRRRG
jgi:DNA-binding transcriptional MerR regulator